MKVFEPFKINQMELKNRMVVSAMVTNYCSEDGMATEKFMPIMNIKQKGGGGLIDHRRLCSDTNCRWI